MASTSAAGVDLNESQQGETRGILIPFAALAVMAVALRFWSRGLMKLLFGLDDYLCVIGLVFTLGCFALSMTMVQLGSGLHFDAVPLENVPKYLQCLYSYQLVYATSILFIKTSILAYYKRIFSVRQFRIAVYALGALVLAWWIAVVFISIFSCKPIHGFWDKAINPRCVNTKTFYIGNAVPNIVTDVLILAMPIRMVWTLQTTRPQKVSLSFIFLLGSFVVICSCVRLYEQFKVDEPDFTWEMNGTVIWTSLEVSLGVISACLPTMRPLLRWALHKPNLSVSATNASAVSESYRAYGPKRGFETLPSGSHRYVPSLETGVSCETVDSDPNDIPLGKIWVKNDVQVGSQPVGRSTTDPQ
ncbi:hypothetical protein P170DRAFT_469499 [Aspergillus steynii IBT 23096]|uniref:Rhodopsin domain-containing protein n=1 Tax=Aspergillus steynii IBT 23096 TaxID=1392250 RepID=A0A2I2GMB7_9EURO|nr:uncharacterized protein P170DRAFT_469499 [Aspergillus steynii IBT 23096]PLB54028.1 hypothetical protein P170DRAFT_469499 [Aspergillus steynii IBT 23096]